MVAQFAHILRRHGLCSRPTICQCSRTWSGSNPVDPMAREPDAITSMGRASGPLATSPRPPTHCPPAHAQPDQHLIDRSGSARLYNRPAIGVSPPPTREFLRIEAPTQTLPPSTKNIASTDDFWAGPDKKSSPAREADSRAANCCTALEYAGDGLAQTRRLPPLAAFGRSSPSLNGSTRGGLAVACNDATTATRPPTGASDSPAESPA